MNNEKNEKPNGNKHYKVEVNYMGSDKKYNHNYLPEDTVLKIKLDAISFFELNANPNTQRLQYIDCSLNDADILENTPMDTGSDRNELYLLTKENQDTDGGR